MVTITPLDAVLGAEGPRRRPERRRRRHPHAYPDRRAICPPRHRHQGPAARPGTGTCASGGSGAPPSPTCWDHMRMPGYPDLMTVGNTERRDEDPKIRNGAALWAHRPVLRAGAGERDHAVLDRRPRAQRRDAVLRHGHRVRQSGRGDPAGASTASRSPTSTGAASGARASRRRTPSSTTSRTGACRPVLPSPRDAPPDHRPQGALRARPRGACRQGDARRRGGGAARRVQGPRAPGAPHLPPQVRGGRPGGVGHVADDARRDADRRRLLESGLAAPVAHQRARPGPRCTRRRPESADRGEPIGVRRAQRRCVRPSTPCTCSVPIGLRVRRGSGSRTESRIRFLRIRSERRMSEPPLEGGCLCGAVRYRIDAPPLWTAYCHCATCRRSTGAPVTMFVGARSESVRFTAGERAMYASSPDVQRGFCARCGTPLTYESERRVSRRDPLLRQHLRRAAGASTRVPRLLRGTAGVARHLGPAPPPRHDEAGGRTKG